MASIPYSVLLSQNDNILPKSTILEHQKFCKNFIKAHQSFEKYKNNNSKSKLAFISDNVFILNKKEQNQLDILTWYNNLPEKEKIKIFTIKNKWLVNFFTQLFFIYYKMGNYSYKPLPEMEIFFDDQKKYTSKDENSNCFESLFNILKSKNITVNSNILYESKNKNKKEENDNINNINNELYLYSNFFESKEIIDKDYINSQKREYEKKFIENIRVICSEKDNYDTITFTKEFIMNIDTIKDNLKFFTGEKYFREWLVPINAKNIYNFILPYWMHNLDELNLCQLIIGFFEQKMLLNYEYYYYTKKNYEFSYDKQILELYKENSELVKFITNNYSFNKNNKNKEEILTQEKIIKVVDSLRESENFNKRLSLVKDIFNKICSQKACYRGKEIIFNDEFGKEVYNKLNKEILKEKEKNYISKMLDLITFIRFLDLINLEGNIYYGYRKSIIDSQCNIVLDELKSEGFLNKKVKKNKKKKKKKDGGSPGSQSGDNNNNTIKNNKTEDKKIPTFKKNIYDVQTKEIECEYNMNIRTQNMNMIQENASNVSINSYNSNNNSIIFIQGNKKSEPKKEEKIEKKEKKEEKKEEKEEKKIEKIDTKIKIEDKKEEKDIKKVETENEIKNNKEEEIKNEVKEKNKNKDFFLYPINQNKKKDSNNYSDVKEKNKKNKKKKKKHNNNNNNNNNNIKEDEKETKTNNNNKINNSTFNFVQERKNNVQINPCPRRKKKVPFQTSSINFEMRMKRTFNNSYPYYYSFPMMKPFTTLSEVSTKFSMPSTIINNNNNNKQPQNNINNINYNKKHWDYSQYNSNYNNPLQIFNSFVPSDKYFESLNKELNNYLSVTNHNISNLKTLYDEKLQKIENLINNGLSENYEIKFGHYGSYFSNLSIEGSDLDILIYYHKKKEENDFYKDILNLLEQNNNEFENVCPILTASVPVIKLQIDINEEIKNKDIKLKITSYLEEEDLSKIKIDLTFTENELDFQNSHESITYINKSLNEYQQIKPILLLLKRYFKEMNMNKNYTGGLCSYSLFLLVLSFCKCNKQCESPTKLLYYFLENFTYFDYCNYCIDVEKENCYILKEKNENIAEKSVSEENSSYDTNYDMYDKEEIYIVDPISKLNVSKSSFKVDEIILTFRKAFNLLYYEAWSYTNKNNEKEIIDNKNELYIDDSSEFIIIKNLFGLKTMKNNFDFYFN